MKNHSKKQNRIALFGGTFNPIHCGHIAAAKEAVALCNLDAVYLIPSFIPPHRGRPAGALVSDRYQMVSLAAKEDPRLIPSDFELLQKGKSYSIKTVRHFLQAEPKDTKVHFLIGTDAFAEIDTWREVNDLLALCDFLVMARPGWKFDLTDILPKSIQGMYRVIEKDRLVHQSGAITSLIRIQGLKISSSDIRTRVEKGLPIDKLVPETVFEYIQQFGLYQKTQE